MKQTEDLEKELRRQIEEEAEALLEQARREGKERLEEARREQERKRSAFRRRLDDDLALRRRRALAKAELERKNLLLRARREEVDRLFEAARKHLEEIAVEDPGRFEELLWSVYLGCRKELPGSGPVRVMLGRGAGGLRTRLDKEKEVEVENRDDFVGLLIESSDGRMRWDGSLKGMLQEIRRGREAEIEEHLFAGRNDGSDRE